MGPDSMKNKFGALKLSVHLATPDEKKGSFKFLEIEFLQL